VSAQPYVTNFPNNVKQAKYNYNDPANTHNLDLINQHKLDHMNDQRDYLFICKFFYSFFFSPEIC